MKRSAAALAALTLAPATAAQAAPLEIRPGKLGVARIGDFKPRANASIGAAVRAFGRPSSKRVDDNVCFVRWNDRGLKITFANFGLPPKGQDTCSPDVGLAQTFRATGSFRTWRGLRMGARRAAVKRRHPSAERHARGYWLEVARSPYGDGSRYPVVKAIVEGNRVVAFSGWIGAAGD